MVAQWLGRSITDPSGLVVRAYGCGPRWPSRWGVRVPIARAFGCGSHPLSSEISLRAVVAMWIGRSITYRIVDQWL